MKKTHKKKMKIDLKYLFKKLGLNRPKRQQANRDDSQIIRSANNKRKGGRRIAIRVKNKRKFLTIAGAGVLVLGAVIAVVVLATSGSTSQAADGQLQAANVKDAVVKPADSAAEDKHADISAAEDKPIPTTKPEAKASIAMPVYTALNITEGTKADVVMQLQLRLMELDYMDADEPDNIYGSVTKEAIERFQKQHDIDVTGVVDQQTYDLMMSGKAHSYIILIGEENTNVQALQQRLYELGYISTVTGYFGTDTEAAVMKFQKLNDLSEDGKVGKYTREMLYSSDAAANSFSYGEESPEIKEYQQRLKKLGYLTTDPDGNFGDDTKAAVKRFQENNGLIADGYIGPSTRTALLSDDAQYNALAIGNKGDDVQSVQNRLKELGYIKKTTGYFGSETDTAVRSFQKNNGLSVDGKVGPRTMNVLMSSGAKKSTGASITGPNVSSFISVARSKKGSRYVRGGKGPNTFDCSGFVYWCLNKVGIKQAYMTSHTWAKCTKYTRIDRMSDMKRGDIIVFKGHVAIYAGNGVMIDASSSNGKVVERSCTSSWSKNSFICAYRVF